MKFPFDKLKIDKSFVTEAQNDKTAQDILETIARLGSIMDLTVTAEGVESNQQAKFLNSVSCDQMQGFLFGRPIPEKEIAAYLLATKHREMEDFDSGKTNVVDLLRSRKATV